MIRISQIRLEWAIRTFLLLQLASAAEDVKFCPPGRCLCEKPAHEIHGDESPKTPLFACCKPVWENELNKDGRPVHGIEYTWKNTETTPFSPWGFGVGSSVKNELLQRSHHTNRCEEKSDYYNHHVAHVLATGSSPRWKSLVEPHEL
jgi:hypothetical protein